MLNGKGGQTKCLTSEHVLIKLCLPYIAFLFAFGHMLNNHWTHFSFTGSIKGHEGGSRLCTELYRFSCIQKHESLTFYSVDWVL